MAPWKTTDFQWLGWIPSKASGSELLAASPWATTIASVIVEQAENVNASGERDGADSAPMPKVDTIPLSPWGEGQGEGAFSFFEGPASPPSPGAELGFVFHLEYSGRADLSPRGEASSCPINYDRWQPCGSDCLLPAIWFVRHRSSMAFQHGGLRRQVAPNPPNALRIVSRTYSDRKFFNCSGLFVG